MTDNTTFDDYIKERNIELTKDQSDFAEYLLKFPEIDRFKAVGTGMSFICFLTEQFLRRNPATFHEIMKSFENHEYKKHFIQKFKVPQAYR
jgi:polyhydroxyalkanoate synthesis regulator protein